MTNRLIVGAAVMLVLAVAPCFALDPQRAIVPPPGATNVVNYDLARDPRDNGVSHAGPLAICAETDGPPIVRGAKRIPATFVWIDEARVNERGERVVRRIVATGPGACDPSWSPEGKRLAVTSPDGLWVFVDVTSDMPRGERIVDTTGRPEAVAPPTEYKGLVLSKPKWSPDGARLAYVASNGGTTWVEVVDAATGKRLFKSDPETSSFAWGSDSRSLKIGDKTMSIP